MNGWSGRGSGLVLPSYLRMQIAHPNHYEKPPPAEAEGGGVPVIVF